MRSCGPFHSSPMPSQSPGWIGWGALYPVGSSCEVCNQRSQTHLTSRILLCDITSPRTRSIATIKYASKPVNGREYQSSIEDSIQHIVENVETFCLILHAVRLRQIYFFSGVDVLHRREQDKTSC